MRIQLLLFIIFFFCSCKISIQNTPPRMVLVADVVTGISPLSINFDASRSYDSDGEIVTYKWYYGDSIDDVSSVATVVTGGNSGLASTVGGNSINSSNNDNVKNTKTTHTYFQPGRYFAYVVGTDQKGATTTSNKVEINVVDSAKDEIDIGDPLYQGSGCNEGELTTILTADKHAFTIIFDNFRAESGNGVSDDLFSKRCKISLPVKVPVGRSIAVFKLDYRGFIDLPLESKASIEVNYNFYYPKLDISSSMINIRHDFIPSISENFYLVEQMAEPIVIWSGCQEEVNLQIDNILTTKSNPDGEYTLLLLDSIDGVSGITYHLGIKDCQK